MNTPAASAILNMTRLQSWCISGIDLLVALVIIITGARICLDWHLRIRLHIQAQLTQNQENEVIGI